MSVESQPQPLTWVLTGGIATGKSTALRLLREQLPDAVVFDADACVAGLYSDPEVVSSVAAAVGREVVGEGGLRRDRVRARVLEDPEAKRDLEQILHPRVRASFEQQLAAAKAARMEVFIADIPLYFEAGACYPAHRVITVAACRATQLARLRARTGWSAGHAEAMMSLQLPIEEKILRADAVWWNQGSQAVLARQISRSCAAWTGSELRSGS